MSATMTFTPQHSSPLARTTSPFKDPRPPPCTPNSTAQLWDECERRAVENARRRDTACTSSRRQTQQSSRLSSGTVLDIIKSYDPHSSPRVPLLKGSPQFDFGFPARFQPLADSTTVAICKTCKEPITSTLGICAACKKTIVLSPSPIEASPPLTPPKDSQLETDQIPLSEEKPSSTASPKRRSRRSSTAPLLDIPIRLSSLKPLTQSQSKPRPLTEVSRPRKASLPPQTELPRLNTSRKPPSSTPPPSPTTPPSTLHSQASGPRIRPCSLANITTPPTTANVAYHGGGGARQHSATPSELSTMFPYVVASSPPSVCRTSYQAHNAVSAWEDSDSEDEEKVGLVGYWRGRRWRSSRGSLERGNNGRDGGAGKEGEGGRRRRRGFARVISCGCDEE